MFDAARGRGGNGAAKNGRVLGGVGERIRQYAKAHGGKLPLDAEDLIRAGVIAPSEIEFEDGNAMSTIRREFRLVPSIDFPGDLVIIRETCARFPDYKMCLELDGSAVSYGTVDAVAQDNERRLELRLQPIWE